MRPFRIHADPNEFPPAAIALDIIGWHGIILGPVENGTVAVLGTIGVFKSEFFLDNVNPELIEQFVEWGKKVGRAGEDPLDEACIQVIEDYQDAMMFLSTIEDMKYTGTQIANVAKMLVVDGALEMPEPSEDGKNDIAEYRGIVRGIMAELIALNKI